MPQPEKLKKKDKTAISSRNGIIFGVTYRTWWRILVTLLLLGLLYEALNPFHSVLRYYTKWIECGNKPSLIITGYKQESVFIENARPSQGASGLGGEIYFCNRHQAEEAGYL